MNNDTPDPPDSTGSPNRRAVRFRRAIANAPVPVLLHAEDGEILQISRTVTELTGYTPSDLPTIAAWIEQAYGGDERAIERAAADIDRLYALDERVDEGEYHIHTRDGDERVWQFSSSPAGTDEQGRRLVVSMAADITERKRAEAERETHASQQATLAAFGLDALAETDLQALFDRAVAVVHETFQTDFTELLALQPDGDLLLRAGRGWRPGLVGTATVPADTGSQAGYTLTVDEPVIVDELASETRFRGPALLTEPGVVSGMTVVIGGLAAPFGVVGTHTRAPRTFSDDDARFLQSVANVVASVIERIEAQQHLEERVAERTRDLRESEARLRTEKERSERIIESSFDGIFAFDPDLRYTTWSSGAERIMGLPREDVLGRVTHDVFPFFRETGELKRQRAALTGKAPGSSSVPYVFAQSGRTGYYESRYTPLRSGSGEIVGAVGIIRDVTEQKRAREEVEQSERTLAGVLLGSLDGIAALEAVRGGEGEIVDFVFLVVNPAAAEVYGRRAEDLLGKRYLPAFPSARPSGIFDTFARVIETGEPYRGEIHYDADGITGWFDFTVVKLGDGIAQTFRDVTEQKVAEAALRESEARFRELFEGSPDAIFVESLDGLVLDVNPAACRLHNASRDWLVGRTLRTLVPPEYREQARADFERLASGELHLLESHSYTADGLVIPVEVRTDRITYGGQDAVLLHVRDVTEREAAEHALRESEERFAKAFHAAPVGMTISTFSENRYLDVNESFCALTGYTRDELIGQTSAQIGLVPDDDASIPGLDQLESVGHIHATEFTIRTKSGALRDVLTSAELIEIGGMTCILGIGFDVTERKRLEREVIEATELERRRIGQDLHDELGQQLTGAAFLGQVLTQRLADAERAEAEDARQLTALINQVLAEARDLSRLLSPVDVFADGLVDALQDLVDQTERIFEVPATLNVEGDVQVSDNAVATHLYRIAQEAVNNAIKHAAPTTLRVSLTHDAVGLRLQVEDDGTGIEPAAIEQPSGIGLRTMRYRASLIGGTLRIGRAPTESASAGSAVSVLIPNEA